MPHLPYNDTLDDDDQISAEEFIAAKIFDHPRWNGNEYVVQQLSKTILEEILRRFRPDFFN